MSEANNPKSAQDIIDRAINYIQRADYKGEFEYSARMELMEDLQAVKACLKYLAKFTQKDSDAD